MINNLKSTVDDLISELEQEYIWKRRGFPYLGWNSLNPQEPLIRESLMKMKQ